MALINVIPAGPQGERGPQGEQGVPGSEFDPSGLQSQIDSNDIELADHETRISVLESSGSTTKMIVIEPSALSWSSLADGRVSQSFFFFGTSVANQAFAPVHLPDGAIITEVECALVDANVNLDLRCSLAEISHTADSTTQIALILSSGAETDVVRFFKVTGLSHIVDRDANYYQAQFNDVGCASAGCAFHSMKITYTIP